MLRFFGPVLRNQIGCGIGGISGQALGAQLLLELPLLAVLDLVAPALGDGVCARGKESKGLALVVKKNAEEQNGHNFSKKIKKMTQ